MPSELFVTLADNRFVTNAQQVFSSLYFNGKWRGQTMLLSHGISKQKLKWFTERGILIKECRPLSSKTINNYAPVVNSKLYLFETDLKKWQHVIYTDADVIIRTPINLLLKTNGFMARPESNGGTLGTQFQQPDSFQAWVKLFYLKRRFSFSQPAFNSGVLAFCTDIITQTTFSELSDLLRSYGALCKYVDQAVLNMFFISGWESMPLAYNAFPKYLEDFEHVPPDKIRAHILHFGDVGNKNKPWSIHNYFHKEWLRNLQRADQVHF